MKFHWLILVCLGATLSFVNAQQRDTLRESQLILVGDHRMCLQCVGASDARMTIIFESGGGGTSQDWATIQNLLPPNIRSCAYDRAGLGKSEPGPSPRTMRQEVFELHALLEAANIQGPYILVGQSLGGLLVRLYAMQYRSEVAGMVLVDPTHESSVLGSMRYGGWTRLREKATGAPIPAPRLKGSVEVSQQLDVDYMAEEFHQIHLSRIDDPVQLKDIPLVVIRAGKRLQPPGTPDELWKELRQERDHQVEELASLSRNSKFIHDDVSGHLVHRDNPDLVVHAILEVFKAATTGSRLTP